MLIKFSIKNKINDKLKIIETPSTIYLAQISDTAPDIIFCYESFNTIELFFNL